MSSEPLSDRALIKGEVSVSMGTEDVSEEEDARKGWRERERGEQRRKGREGRREGCLKCSEYASQQNKPGQLEKRHQEDLLLKLTVVCRKCA